jgi:Polysulphide reductase, NrfD
MRIKTDGRDIDIRVGILTGEAALQRASGGGSDDELCKAQTWTELPEPDAYDPTYYDRPLLQESVWTWAVPAYYYVGGLSGACAVLAAALQLRNANRFEDLVRRCHLIGAAGTIVSGALLVYDLGRPSRFLNMLRVFRPTSPMNVGAWILTGAGGTFSAAVVLQKTVLGKPAGFAAGVFGLGLATYTGVLVGNSAIPLWSASRRVLPILFAASAVASVGSAFDIFYDTPVTRTFGNVGRVCELAAAVAMEREASRVEHVGRPFRQGVSGAMWRTATVLTASSLLASLLPKQNRGTRLLAGVCGTLGGLLMRFSIEQLGNASARDPRATFRQQRAGVSQN